MPAYSKILTMKTILLLLFLLPVCLVGQTVRTSAYKQDVAVHFTVGQGMPAEKMLAVWLEERTPVVRGEHSVLRWDG